ncbi:MAG TPA: hypothetical protein VD963_04675 [Phycisphaerales bacterium]|nr:hypothetical protein [Phycisphaerales bacterium]
MTPRPLGRPAALLVLLGLMLVPTAAVSAQMIGPIPPATPPTPAYQPPAPPTPMAPPPRPAPEPEGPLPSIVSRDQAGALIPISTSPEEAAVLALDLPEEARPKVRSGIEAHHREMERRVIENLALALETRRQLATLAEISDFNRFEQITRSLAPIRAAGLLDRLVREQAISPRQRRRVEAVVDEYRQAVNDDITREVGEGNVQELLPVAGRRMVQELAAEGMRALDRVLGRAAERGPALLDGLDLSDEQRTRARGLLGGAARGAERASERPSREVIELFMDVLTPEQGQRALRAANPDLFREEPAPAPQPDPRSDEQR